MVKHCGFFFCCIAKTLFRCYYESMWNPDYLEEFNRRLKLLQLFNEDKALRKRAMAHYKNDPVAWINDWCITYDPRKKANKVMPFILFKRQEEFVWFIVECLRDTENGLVEKSRDMGASWICCAVAAWLWIFHGGSAIGIGSRKEEYVDKRGDPKAIFPKIRMILENLPGWMLPVNYESRVHAAYMKIINPANGANITGEAGDNIGRGGRTTMYIKDESAWYERPDAIEAALGDNTDVQIDISSVQGTSNVFYRRRMAGIEWEPGKIIEKGVTRVFVMDWRDHPLKTQEWYDLRRAKAEREGLLHLFAQEVDRDYTSALERIIIPQIHVKAAIDAHIKLGFGDDGERVAGLDVADEGGDRNAFTGRYGVILRYADEWAEGDTGETARRAVAMCRQYNISEMYYDCIGVGAGIKSEINRLRNDDQLPDYLRVQPWNAGGAVINPDDHLLPGDSDSPLNQDHFSNLKAQGWFMLAMRFEKTYRAVTKGATYPPEELISLDSNIPKIHALCMQLSQATRKYNGKGKMVVDKKPDGSYSPNLADSLVECYWPTRELSILDVL